MTSQLKCTVSISSLLTILAANGAFASAVDMNPLEAILHFGEKASAQTQMNNILESQGTRLDSQSSLQVMGAVENDGLTTIKARQLYKGVPVLGTLMAVEQGNDSNFFTKLESLSLSVDARVSKAQAVAIAQTVTNNPISRAPELAIMPSADRSTNRLTYWVDVPSTDLVPGVEVVIDAQSGKIIAEITKLETADVAPITVIDAKEQYMIVDPIWSTPAPVVVVPPAVPAPAAQPTLVGCNVTDPVTGKVKLMNSAPACEAFLQNKDVDMKTRCQILLKDALAVGNTFPVMFDPATCTISYYNSAVIGTPSVSAQQAFENAKKVLTYYRDEQARDSFDGKSAMVLSVANAGLKLSNAAWLSDRDMMVYGAGDGVDFGNFTQFVDVAGHEMTHGVVSKTAKLSYMDESGALNEAVADFFGKMIAKDGNWLIGKGLFKADPTKGLRSLEKPSIYNSRFIDATGAKSLKPYPETLAQKFPSFGACDQSNDRCYVHTNSTIPSHGFYLIHEAVGRDKAQKIIYNALIRYMTSATNFKDAGAAVRKACGDLYDSATCGLVDTSLKAVGI